MRQSPHDAEISEEVFAINQYGGLFDISKAGGDMKLFPVVHPRQAENIASYSAN